MTTKWPVTTLYFAIRKLPAVLVFGSVFFTKNFFIIREMQFWAYVKHQNNGNKPDLTTILVTAEIIMLLGKFFSSADDIV